MKRDRKSVQAVAVVVVIAATGWCIWGWDVLLALWLWIGRRW